MNPEVSVWCCATTFTWGQEIPSTDRDTVYCITWGLLPQRAVRLQRADYGYRCTCPGFTHNSRCKHTRAAAASGFRCGWNSVKGTEPLQSGTGALCPCCGQQAIRVSNPWQADPAVINPMF